MAARSPTARRLRPATRPAPPRPPPIRRAPGPRPRRNSLSAQAILPWAGFLLISVALIALVSLLWPERPPTAAIARLVTRGFGWLAGLPLAWLGAVGIVLLAPGAYSRPWVWWRLVAAAGTILGLLTLDAFESSRPDGILARTLAHGLQNFLGAIPAGTLTVWFTMGCLLAATGIHPSRIARMVLLGAKIVGSGGGALVRTARSLVATLRPLVVDLWEHWAARPSPVATPGAPTPPEGAPGPAPTAASTADRPPGAWKPPPTTLFSSRTGAKSTTAHLREQARIIEETLASFSIEAHVLEINQGPAVSQFGVEPAVGVPVSRITARIDDLALRLGVTPIRIEAPVPGRRMLGIEVPNTRVSVVGLREILESDTYARSRAQIPIALGRDIGGKPVVADLARMPHLLIAGATGSGKSVCINAMVTCLLSQFTPDHLQFLMVDPKRVELVNYNGIPHLRMPVVTEMERIVGTLKWATREMERRYKLFAAHTTRNIDGYNQAVRGRPGERPLAYLVIIIDELADLMMTAPEEAERTLCRLAQLARATGIHLVLCTQRPSVDVVTGLIKANFPTRIAFAVTSQVDSRVILDTVGAERLLGRGDMLYLPPDASKPIRIQGTYVSDEEIEALVAYWHGLGVPQYDQRDLADVEELAKPADPGDDDLYERALELAQQAGRISVSFLQRRLGIGYPRAARLVDLLEERGVVSSGEDGRREVLVQGRLPDSE